MTKAAELGPTSETKRSISRRIRISRYLSGPTLAAGAVSGAITGNTIVNTGHGNNTAALITFLAFGLGFSERQMMYRKTNRTVIDFEQAQYEALPTQRISEVVNLFTREVVVEGKEVKPAEKPDKNPPERFPAIRGYIATAGPVPASIGWTAAYRTAFESVDSGTRIAGGAFAATMLGLGGLCLNMGNAALASHEYECSRRIDAAAAPIPASEQ